MYFDLKPGNLDAEYLNIKTLNLWLKSIILIRVTRDVTGQIFSLDGNTSVLRSRSSQSTFTILDLTFSCKLILQAVHLFLLHIKTVQKKKAKRMQFP